MSDIVSDFMIIDAKMEDIPGIIDIDKELGGLLPNLEAKVKNMIANENDYFLVAKIKNQVVGYAGGSIRECEFGEDDPIGYISHVGLAKELKSKGMGRMLGDRLIETMGEKCEMLRTILSLDRIDLQSFFNHIGFSRSDLLVYEYRYNV